MTSWVVALHTVFDTADPVTLCWAAVIRSVMLCPDIFAHSTWQQHTQKKPHTHTHSHTHKTGRWVKSSLVWGLSLSQKKEKKKEKENLHLRPQPFAGPPSLLTLYLPTFPFLPRWEWTERLGYGRLRPEEGGIKRSSVRQQQQSRINVENVSSVSVRARSDDLRGAVVAGSARWLIRPGSLPRSHPDVAHRFPACLRRSASRLRSSSSNRLFFLLLLLLPLPPLLGFKAQWKEKREHGASEWGEGEMAGLHSFSALPAPPCRPWIRSDTAGTLWCRWTWADRSPAGGGEERRGEDEACIDWGVDLQQAWQWRNETQDSIMLSESDLIVLYCTWDQCNKTAIKTWWCCFFFRMFPAQKRHFVAIRISILMIFNQRHKPEVWHVYSLMS